jgi:hypothetical protein
MSLASDCVPSAVPRVLSTNSKVARDCIKSSSCPHRFQTQDLSSAIQNMYTQSSQVLLLGRSLSSQRSTSLILRIQGHLPLVPGSFGLLSIVDEKEVYCMCNQRSIIGIPITDFCSGRLFTGQGHTSHEENGLQCRTASTCRVHNQKKAEKAK